MKMRISQNYDRRLGENCCLKGAPTRKLLIDKALLGGGETKNRRRVEMRGLKNFKIAMTLIQLTFIFLATVCVCAMAFAETPEDIQTLIEAAKKEGHLSLYSSGTAAQCQLFLDRFREKYPFIKTDYYRTGKVGLLTRTLTEHRFKKYSADVILTSATSAYILKKSEVLAKYFPPESKFLPEELRDPEGYWPGVYISEVVLAYNKNLVSSNEVPKRYEDLLDPKWKGKMEIEVNKVEWFANLLKSKGEGFFEKFSQQKPSLRTGNQLGLQLLAAGEFNILADAFLYSIEESKSMGMPIEWIGLEPVTTYLVSNSLLANAPHPNAAKLFINFMLTKEGQNVVVEFGRTPIRSDVESKYKKLLNNYKTIMTDIKMGEIEKEINDLVRKYFR